MKCKCVACEHGEEALIKFQNESMAKYGWFAHYVDKLDEGTNLVNFHTHGLSETHGHLDFQVVLPLNAETCHSIFWTLVRMIENDKRVFSDGEVAQGVLGNGYSVLFKKAKEGDRDVLRLIIPDKDNIIDQDWLDGLYKEQYIGLC